MEILNEQIENIDNEHYSKHVSQQERAKSKLRFLKMNVSVPVLRRFRLSYMVYL